MDKKYKATVWLIVFIFIFLIVVTAGVYAYYMSRDLYLGSFNVEVTTKGVDLLKINENDDIVIKADSYNFIRDVGHSVSGTTNISATLNTTKEKIKYCYDVYVKVPDEEVFEYSNYPEPELTLSVYSSSDGVNYSTLINNIDITKKTNKIDVINDNIFTNKNVENTKYYRATITLQYFPTISQEQNEYLSYNASLVIDNVVECN